MTMLNRSSMKVSPQTAFTDTEISILDKLAPKTQSVKKKNLSYYLVQLAKLGGYLARNSDPPPGNTVIWRGLSKLIDIELGFNLATKSCG